jgi:hypothetical protein
VEIYGVGEWTSVTRLPLANVARDAAFSFDGRWLVVESWDALHLFETKRWRQHAALSLFAEATLDGWPYAERNREVLTDGDSRWLAYRAEVYKYRTPVAEVIRIWEVDAAAEVARRIDSTEFLHPTREERALIHQFYREHHDAPGIDSFSVDEEGRSDLLGAVDDWTILGTRHDPGGRWIANSVGETLDLLEAGTGRSIVSFRQGSGINDVDFDPSGAWLAIAGSDGVYLWTLGPVDKLIEEACARLSRNLTAEEWATYLTGAPAPTCPEPSGR